MEIKNSLPSVSIIIPTLNSEKVLEDCLESIEALDYSKEKIEIIIADGGSTDSTLDIAKKYDVDRILPNPLKTSEAGKAVGLRYAKNEIVAFIDSDNILPIKNWLKQMIKPLEEPDIVGSEPIEYTYRKGDGYITRYCALMGMNDPLCLFLGNYDRYNQITRRWTQMPVVEEDKGVYLKVTLDSQRLPTIGANGTILRRKLLDEYRNKDYLFDIDVIAELAALSRNKFAKVKTGIIHLFSGNVATFKRKQRRRIRDYLYYNKLGVRQYPWGRQSKLGVVKFVVYCLLVFPLIGQSLIGFIRKPDKAWFFHPIACWITLWEYGRERIWGFFAVKELGRAGWSQ